MCVFPRLVDYSLSVRIKLALPSVNVYQTIVVILQIVNQSVHPILIVLIILLA